MAQSVMLVVWPDPVVGMDDALVPAEVLTAVEELFVVEGATVVVVTAIVVVVGGVTYSAFAFAVADETTVALTLLLVCNETAEASPKSTR